MSTLAAHGGSSDDDTTAHIPVIDVSALLGGDGAPTAAEQRTARAIDRALRSSGFFYVSHHGVPEALITELWAVSRAFFALPLEEKLRIDMQRGGRAWRGFFPCGRELTSGAPDHKEGLYLGPDLGTEHPAVVAGLPFHGQNQYPARVPRLAPVVREYMARLTRLGHAIMRGVALGLGIDPGFFKTAMTADPFTPFRIFNYPKPETGQHRARWGVGEHTDYGVLTILLQDDSGGLEVKSPSDGSWVAAPPKAGTFVINAGDCLERWTNGLYRATPHRVRNRSGGDRLSAPFFFDPNFHTLVEPLAACAHSDRGADPKRWAHLPHKFMYGEYFLGKVSKVFPDLAAQALQALHDASTARAASASSSATSSAVVVAGDNVVATDTTQQQQQRQGHSRL